MVKKATQPGRNAKGQFGKGHKISKGKGRPKDPPGAEGYELKEIRKLTKAEFRRSVDKFLFMGLDKVTELDINEWNCLDAMVIQIIKKGVADGDYVRLNFLLDRLVGKVTEKIEMEVPKPFVIEKIDGGTIEAGVTLDAIDVTPKELTDGKGDS